MSIFSSWDFLLHVMATVVYSSTAAEDFLATLLLDISYLECPEWKRMSPVPERARSFVPRQGLPRVSMGLCRGTLHTGRGALTRGAMEEEACARLLGQACSWGAPVSAFSPAVWLCEACLPECDPQADGMNSCYPHSDDYLMGN